jgi:hypothetical protein
LQKLFRYRPLSEFLFKELYYQEIYFASYQELNDPLDMSARVEFSPREENEIEYLIWVLLKTTLTIFESNISESEQENNNRLVAFSKNEELRKLFKKSLFLQLNQLKSSNSFIDIDLLEHAVSKSVEDCSIDFNINLPSFRNEIQRLSIKFLENSYATCFSETNNDFLMWSHYASKHSGLCLEFSLENDRMFPYIFTRRRKNNQSEDLQRISNWQIEANIIWEGLNKVDYKDEQAHINFFEFAPVFDNEYDCDLIGLSKSWTHRFAYELKNVFSTKTKPWSYEKEWRAIEINFGDKQEPEERIKHYPIETLSSIYFGMRTPESVKKRIFEIFSNLRKDLQYFECKPTNGRELTFESWENFDD